MYMSTGACGGQRHWIPKEFARQAVLDLDFWIQVVIGHLMWVLRTKLRTSALVNSHHACCSQ